MNQLSCDGVIANFYSKLTWKVKLEVKEYIVVIVANGSCFSVGAAFCFAMLLRDFSN